MAEATSNVHETIEVDPAQSHGGGHAPVSPLSPDAQMVVWTWVTFSVVAFILYRVAWKPILAALEAREHRIHQALEDADQARAAVGQIAETQRTMRAETERECKAMIAAAREAAAEAANQVEKKAHERVKVLYENAERDIEALKNRVIADIRREQAELVVNVSGRLIAQNLDTDRNRALADKLIAEF
ncbi:MAG: F0F1 ATP synthase subunit B [Lentisphaerae bacterium]|nr:F0F1 ATP synthase subunit B [Lentisphaerota bacterium]